MSDPRKAQTLGEHDMYKLLAELTESANPGHGMSEKDVKKLWEEVQARKVADAQAGRPWKP